MQIRIARTLDDIQSVTPLVEDETWEHARKFLDAAPNDPFADHLRWLEDDRRPVACVQVFLHQYPVGRAQAGMCLPEYPFVPPELRGRGYFKRLMADLFGWMRGAGCPLAYDHGRKGLYTGIGFAPCFHHCMVLIRVEDALRIQAPGRAEPATEADLAANEHMFRAPFPLGRGLQCRDERWRPDAKCLLVTRSSQRDGITGFVVVSKALVGRTANDRGFDALKPPERDKALTITDSWAGDVVSAAALLHTVAEGARELGCQWVRLNCRRSDTLARLCVLAGGELRWSAAQERDCSDDGEDIDAFYLADLHLAIEQLLPELDARWRAFSGAAPPTVRLDMEGEGVGLHLGRRLQVLDDPRGAAAVIRLPRKAMTRALLGYATPTELSLLHEDCCVPDKCQAAADALFSAREPHLVHEGWAFAQMPDYGLVP